MIQLLDSYPNKFDDNFIQWLKNIESALLVSFCDWNPSDEEFLQIRQLIQHLGGEVPHDLQIYYNHAYPFDGIKNGVQHWVGRLGRYRETWAEWQRARGVATEHRQESFSMMQPLWPVDCFHRFDTVAFQLPDGNLAVMHIDAQSAKATPAGIGLRNYFLAQVALYTMAAEMDMEPDWQRQLSHPTIASLVQWPDHLLSWVGITAE